MMIMTDVQLKNLERGFHRAMIGIVENTTRLKPPMRFPEFERMLADGGLQTARRLLAMPGVSSGFTRLFLHESRPESLKLSVEYVVLDPQWRPLFSVHELEKAKKTLTEHGCPLPPDVDDQTAPAISAVATPATLQPLRRPVQIGDLAEALNRAASSFEIGKLHALRARLKSSKITSKALFDDRTIRDTYAFHVGGRSELQFNFGFEDIDGDRFIRHGVAFSLETSQALPTIDPLIPKVDRFNEYVRNRAEDLAGFRMWDFHAGVRSAERRVQPIEGDSVRPRTFIMLGTVIREEDANVGHVEQILSDFDRLLPLYRYVESNDPVEIVVNETEFILRRPSMTESATALLPARVVEISLRHNQLQSALDACLREEFGAENVACEHRCVFRPKPITRFGRCRSPISVHVDHPFRSKAITRFGAWRSPRELRPAGS
jgi:hypothetical protein